MFKNMAKESIAVQFLPSVFAQFLIWRRKRTSYTFLPANGLIEFLYTVK